VVYHSFPQLAIIIGVPFDPRGQKAEIDISKVRNAQATKLFFPTDKSLVGQMQFPVAFKVIPQAVSHLGVNEI
jgi:hypothetical protein